MEDMDLTAKFLCENIQGCKLAYVQSDEISLVLTDFDDITTEAWFDGNIQKITSISASMAAAKFNELRRNRGNGKPFIEDIMMAWRAAGKTWDEIDSLRRTEPYNTYPKSTGRAEARYAMLQEAYDQGVISVDALDEAREEANSKLAFFDSRVFVIPDPIEVVNYLIWRQQDATRNSIQMGAQALYSHQQLHGKNTSVLQDMMMEKGVNWNDYPDGFKRGRCVVKETYVLSREEYPEIHRARDQGVIDVERSRWVVEAPPIFTKDREYVSKRIPSH